MPAEIAPPGIARDIQLAAALGKEYPRTDFGPWDWPVSTDDHAAIDALKACEWVEAWAIGKSPVDHNGQPQVSLYFRGQNGAVIGANANAHADTLAAAISEALILAARALKESE